MGVHVTGVQLEQQQTLDLLHVHTSADTLVRPQNQSVVVKNPTSGPRCSRGQIVIL